MKRTRSLLMVALMASLSLLAGCGDDRPKTLTADDGLSEPGSADEVVQATPVPADPPAVPVDGEEADQRGPQKAPVVLMHGMAGFETLGPADYFFGVPDALRKDGHKILVTVVDPFQSVEIRARQAAAQIDVLLAQTGAKKVHLIGHSQGGLDARHLVAGLGYGNRVATLTTIGTPHRGTRVADVGLGIFPGNSAAAIGALADVLLAGATRRDADLTTQLVELSAAHASKTFNPANPDDERVSYFSVGGWTQQFWWVDLRKVDVVNEMLRASHLLVFALDGKNDGLVPLASQKWGDYLGDIPADHLDQMGWFPLQPRPAFDHLGFYRRLARFVTGDGPRPL